MQKLLTTIFTAAALAVAASAAQADCYGSHNVTASTVPSEEAVTMSTYDGMPPVAEEGDQAKEVSAAPVCAEDDEKCQAGTE